MKNKNTVGRRSKSMKGKKGTVGAPLKQMKFPKTAFTVKRIVEMNQDEVCELTVRNRFNRMLKAGEIVRLQDKPQPGGAVGRPNRQFLLKVNVTSDTVLFDPNAPKADAPAKPAKAPKTKKTVKAKTKSARKSRKVKAPAADAPAVTVNDATPTPDVVSLAPAAPAPVAETPAEAPVLTTGTETASAPSEPEVVTAPASPVFAA